MPWPFSRKSNEDERRKFEDAKKLDQAALERFVDELLIAKNDGRIRTERDLLAAREVLLGEINKDINTHLVSLLPYQDQVALDRLLDKDPSDEELNRFFIDSIGSDRLPREIAVVLLRFREAYLHGSEKP